MLAVVSDKTDYPAEMLDLGCIIAFTVIMAARRWPPGRRVPGTVPAARLSASRRRRAGAAGARAGCAPGLSAAVLTTASPFLSTAPASQSSPPPSSSPSAHRL